jgi:hypothetical protein
VKVKTSESSGPALHWMVAKCEGIKVELSEIYPPDAPHQAYIIVIACDFEDEAPVYEPSADWSQGGPIIQLEKIGTNPCSITHPETPWVAFSAAGNVTSLGPTPLIAAMRCYVASKLGDEVEVPGELV